MVALHGDGGKLMHSQLKSLPVSLVGTGPSTCYVGCMNGVVQAVDVRQKLVATDLIEDAHASVIRAMLFFENSHLLITAASDALIRAWDVRKNTMDPVASFDVHGDAVWRLQKSDLPAAFWNSHNSSFGGGSFGSPDPSGVTFLSGGREGTLHAHDLRAYRTSMLAQCSFPIVSFLNVGCVAYCGTCQSDVVGFSVVPPPAPQDASFGSSALLHTPARTSFAAAAAAQAQAQHSSSTSRPAVCFEELTPSSILIDVGAFSPPQSTTAANPSGASSAMNMLLPHAVGDQSPRGVRDGLMSSRELLTLAAGASQPLVGVVAGFLDGGGAEDGEVLLTSPFKPPRGGSPPPAAAEHSAAAPSSAATAIAQDSVKWASPDVNGCPGRPPMVPPPTHILRGGVSTIRTALFPTRLHVAAYQSDGEVVVYDIVNCTKVAALGRHVAFDSVASMLEILPPMCNSWCSVACSWGAVTVTITETDGAGAYLNAWELSRVAHSYMMRLVGQIEKAAVAAAAKVATDHNVAAAPQQQLSLALFPLEELRTMRQIRNVAVWALKQVVASARGGRVSRLLARNLPAHHYADDDKRALVELPVAELAAIGTASGPGGAIGDDVPTAATVAQQPLTAPPQQQPQPQPLDASGAPVRRPVPRWLASHYQRSELVADPPATPTCAFVCEPHPSPPYGRKLGAAFADKKSPLSLPRTCWLSDLASYVCKALKKSAKDLPAMHDVHAARAALRLPAIHDGDRAGGAPRQAEAEEYLVLWASSAAGDVLLDPSMTLGVAAALHQDKGTDRALRILYAAIL